MAHRFALGKGKTVAEHRFYFALAAYADIGNYEIARVVASLAYYVPRFHARKRESLVCDNRKLGFARVGVKTRRDIYREYENLAVIELLRDFEHRPLERTIATRAEHGVYR